jgi:hypothetical protein
LLETDLGTRTPEFIVRSAAKAQLAGSGTTLRMYPR